VPSANTLVRWVNESAFVPSTADSTLPHLWPTGSSWVSPSITARYFSSCPSDSPYGGHPALRSTASSGFSSALAVSSFRFRARLDVCIPSAFFGQRGITPAFGYGAPHSSARGTLTLLNNALLSAQYVTVRFALNQELTKITRLLYITKYLIRMNLVSGTLNAPEAKSHAIRRVYDIGAFTGHVWLWLPRRRYACYVSRCMNRRDCF
jgi:hypothetical protein